MGIPSRRVSCGLHIEFPMSNQKYAHKKGKPNPGIHSSQGSSVAYLRHMCINTVLLAGSQEEAK